MILNPFLGVEVSCFAIVLKEHAEFSFVEPAATNSINIIIASASKRQVSN